MAINSFQAAKSFWNSSLISRVTVPLRCNLSNAGLGFIAFSCCVRSWTVAMNSNTASSLSANSFDFVLRTARRTTLRSRLGLMSDGQIFSSHLLACRRVFASTGADFLLTESDGELFFMTRPFKLSVSTLTY